MGKTFEKILLAIYIISLITLWVGLLIKQFEMITISVVVMVVAHIIGNLE